MLKVGSPFASRYLPLSSCLTALGSPGASAIAAVPNANSKAREKARTRGLICTRESLFEKKCAPRKMPGPAWAPGVSRLAMPCRRLERRRQGKNRQLTAESRVVGERGIAADRAKALGRLCQAGRETDARPAADTRKHRDILLSVVLIGRHVANDARRRLELVEFIAGLGVHRFQIAF